MYSFKQFLFFALFFAQIKSIDLQEKRYVKDVPRGATCILGVDIGGTNSDFGFFEVQDKKPVLLFSLHAPTKTIPTFIQATVEVLQYAQEHYNLCVNHACFGVPGVRSSQKDFSPGGKTGKEVDAKKIKQATGLSTVLILNDFEVIGYGVPLLGPSKVIEINEGEFNPKGTQVIIGAGTGLGTSYMVWSEEKGHHCSVWSELGCTPFCPYIKQELDFSKDYTKKTGRVLDWDRVLGGRYGIVALRSFLFHGSVSELTGGQIFKRYGIDQTCTDTVDMYLQLYARYAKIASLSVLPFGGLYIVGGIIAKNVERFKSGVFLKTLFEDDAVMHKEQIFKRIPVYLVTDYNVSLYGAAQCLLYELKDSGELNFDA